MAEKVRSTRHAPLPTPVATASPENFTVSLMHP
uniref:Uncharacterized protein n=1 Tax=Arundo donax TaxID=35708 RepID=A0A0A9A3G8_ARUDO